MLLDENSVYQFCELMKHELTFHNGFVVEAIPSLVVEYLIIGFGPTKA